MVRTLYKRGPKPALTEKKRRFADEFLANGGRASKAARDAGYSDATAHSIAAVRYDPFVVEYIKERAKVYNNRRAQLKATEVIAQLASVVRSNVADFVEEDLHGGIRLKPLCMMDREKLNAVSEIDIKTSGPEDNPVTHIKLKFWDKNAAATTLCRHFGLFSEGDNGGATDREVIVARGVSALARIVEEARAERLIRDGAGSVPQRPLLPVEVLPPQT